MIRNLHDDAGQNKMVNIIKSYNHTTFDFIGDFAFAESFDSLKTRQDHRFMNIIFVSIKINTILKAIVNAVPPLQICFSLLEKLAMRYDYGEVIHQKVNRRIETGDRERPDLMTGILKNNTDDGSGITRNEIEATATILLGAGAETIATLLSGCTYLLLTNPRVIEKLQEEIRGTCATSDEITITKMNQLPYVHAVLEESLRLYPPVPTALLRTTLPGGSAICGHFVPGNVRICFKCLAGTAY
jgi:Cytochrome P450